MTPRKKKYERHDNHASSVVASGSEVERRHEVRRVSALEAKNRGRAFCKNVEHKTTRFETSYERSEKKSGSQ